MGNDLSAVLRLSVLNKWGLFWLVTAPISLAMLFAMSASDLSGAYGVSSMIQLSVQCAVPWLYVAFAASSLHALFPGQFSRWLLRNRKYFGMCFAAAMAWQAFFILWMITVHTDFYVDVVYRLRSTIEGVAGYAFLLAMTVTSFPRGRRLLNARQWRLLHLTGIYVLWVYAFNAYWQLVYYYPNPDPIHYVYYWAGFAAWALRVGAWHRKRAKAAATEARQTTAHPLARVAAGALIGVGVVAAAMGSAWQPTAEQVLYGYALTELPELYLPYWPFEPFLSLAVIVLGVYLLRPGPAPRLGGLGRAAMP